MEAQADRARPWGRIVLLGMLAGVLLGTLVGAVVVGPYLWDDLAIDRIVRVVALDWRDFGETRARARLEFELDAQGIGMHVRDEDCALWTETDGTRRVRCAWGVTLSIPWIERVIPLRFRSEVSLHRDGALTR